MKEVQKTTIGGSVGLAAFVAVVRYNFQDVPIMDAWNHLQALGVNQIIDIVVPLILGVSGIFYDEEKPPTDTKE